MFPEAGKARCLDLREFLQRAPNLNRLGARAAGAWSAGCRILHGRVAEWLKALVLKTRNLETGSGVRIPSLPPFASRKDFCECGGVFCLGRLSSSEHLRNEKIDLYTRDPTRRDGRVAEGGGLLNHCTVIKTVPGVRIPLSPPFHSAQGPR